jgi:hypothetical protein
MLKSTICSLTLHKEKNSSVHASYSPLHTNLCNIASTTPLASAQLYRFMKRILLLVVRSMQIAPLHKVHIHALANTIEEQLTAAALVQLLSMQHAC